MCVALGAPASRQFESPAKEWRAMTITGRTRRVCGGSHAVLMSQIGFAIESPFTYVPVLAHLCVSARGTEFTYLRLGPLAHRSLINAREIMILNECSIDFINLCRCALAARRTRPACSHLAHPFMALGLACSKCTVRVIAICARLFAGARLLLPTEHGANANTAHTICFIVFVA